MIRDKLRLALMISGGGTTAREIIRACKDGRLPRIVPVCVITSTALAGGIKKAQEEEIDPEDVIVLDPTNFSSPSLFAEAIIRSCRNRAVELIGQYGWMPKTPAEVIATFDGHMINQHPGPIDPGRPDFGGKGMFGRRVHCARLYFLRRAQRPVEDMWTEAIAQRVAVDYDKGAVIRKRTVLIQPDDDPISLQQRVLPEEHQVQIEALADFAEGKITELSRSEPLVRDSEADILSEAKRVAKLLFPEG